MDSLSSSSLAALASSPGPFGASLLSEESPSEDSETPDPGVSEVVFSVSKSSNDLYLISCESFSFPSRIIYPCILFVNEKSKTVNDIRNLIFMLICSKIFLSIIFKGFK